MGKGAQCDADTKQAPRDSLSNEQSNTRQRRYREQAAPLENTLKPTERPVLWVRGWRAGGLGTWRPGDLATWRSGSEEAAFGPWFGCFGAVRLKDAEFTPVSLWHPSPDQPPTFAPSERRYP